MRAEPASSARGLSLVLLERPQHVLLTDSPASDLLPIDQQNWNFVTVAFEQGLVAGDINLFNLEGMRVFDVVEDCAHVSRDLGAMLDVDDLVPGAYTLEVSSPGLDRPLRRTDDYRRFAGRRAKLVMREAVDGQTYFKGRLGGVDDDVVLIDADDGRRHRVPVAVITRANLEVEF